MSAHLHRNESPKMSEPRILIVDDEPKLVRLAQEVLLATGFAVLAASNGRQAVEMAALEQPDLILLDIMLPGEMDGYQVAERVRQFSNVPIIMLTSLSKEEDIVRGLDYGAVDYVTKPFHTEEVLARIRALIRRASGHATSELQCGPLSLDTRASKAYVDGVALKLTSHEYRLLAYLMHHMGKVVSRTELVEHLYDQDFDRDSNTIEVFVGRLRKKMGVDLIETVRGMGYRIADEPTES